jgi:hypothetical protein
MSIEWIRACACGGRTIRAWQVQIVAVAALPEQKPQIFEAPNRSSDPAAIGRSTSKAVTNGLKPLIQICRW